MRRTDLVFFDGDNKPADAWDTTGIQLASLIPTPIGRGPKALHRLESQGTLVVDTVTLQQIITVSNAVLSANGIPPYPGYSEQLRIY